jgi:hypothetical protein
MVLFLFYCAVVANNAVVAGNAVVYSVVVGDSVVVVVATAIIPFGIPAVNLLLS